MSLNKKLYIVTNVCLVIMVICTCFNLVATFELRAQDERTTVDHYIPPEHYSHHLHAECANVVTRIMVSAGGTVWDTIKARIAENADMHATSDQRLTPALLEEETKRTVDDLQDRINADPSLKVRDLNHVPVGYQIDLAEDTSVSQVPGQ